ncbi:type I secretion system permease/ATPase [Mesorhizobium sp. VK4C]|uniref:type I secretion system permease/ATPase n=1 Tax=Mesorhizobium captivum TaxID=3072319 RepID=UPI002A242CE9|nr:type I secretion system permease/ATPase [Mesorhizobium sp. VK4C]MDX8497858.1 type I secretion system permease/ATPase [Mesorhizobium sp. VK4C]
MTMGAALTALGSRLHKANSDAATEQRPLSLLRATVRRKTSRRALRRPVVRSHIPGAILFVLALALVGADLLPRFVDFGGVSQARPWGDPGAGWGYFSDPMALLAGPGTLPSWLAIAALASLAVVARNTSRKRKGNLPGAFANAGASVAEPAPGSELADALHSCRAAFAGVALFSGVSNILMLTGAMFMLQVYDRVLPSRSVPTLIAMAILAGILFVGQALIDLARGRIMTRIGAELDDAVGGRVFAAVSRLPLYVGQQGDGLQPQRDLDGIRTFLSSAGPGTLFDLPWLPFYLAIIWSLHPTLGITATCGAILLVTLTAATEVFTRKPIGAAAVTGVRRNSLAEASRRNAEVLAAMGMGNRLHDHWREASREYLAQQQRVSDIVGGFGSFARALRLMLQSAMLGVGAWLVIQGEATSGIIIAGSILAGRALAPVDLAIAHWRNFVAARQSWSRLSKLLARLPPDAQPMALPVPGANLTVERIAIGAPGAQRIIVQGVEFSLDAGSVLGIIGPSGSGKSSLVRGLVGAWRPLAGRIKLDGAALDQWSSERLGRYIGYLPQDVELFAGTVAANIARFDPGPDPEAIVAAARAAGVHQLIIGLSNGYETQIGEGGTALSAGQRQRVALARALYRDPFLVVLDEPNSNLDIEGEMALAAAILGIKARGGIVAIVAHRPNILSTVDFLLLMKEGQMQIFGTRECVLSKLLPMPQVSAEGPQPVASAPQLRN